MGAFFSELIWGRPLQGLPAWKAVALRSVRLAWVLARDLAYGQLTLRAMGLVYTTLLSLVPLLALSFSVLKAFGVYNQIQPILENFLSPLGEKSADISGWIIGFIENLNIGVLGSIGLALLVYTAVSLMQKIEESFNFIWHVGQLRGFTRRFSAYFSVLLIGPVLAFTLIGVTAAISRTSLMQQLLSVEPLGAAAYAAAQTVPLLLAIAGFSIAYGLVPNARVQPYAAIAGGAVAGTAWEAASWAFSEFVATSTQYPAVYSGFAILILFLIWIYLNWLVLLVGASFAFYLQHPEYVVPQMGEPRLSNRMRERVALMAVYLVGRAFRDGEPAWTFAALTQRLGVPMHALDAVLGALQRGGILLQTGDDPPAFLPARDLHGIAIDDVLRRVRAAGEENSLGPDAMPAPPELESLLSGMEAAAAGPAQGRSLAELLEATAPRGADAAAR
jgi:membrane protein